MSSTSERLEVPITVEYSGGYLPKYVDDGGVLGFDNAQYDHEMGVVRATFHFESEAIETSVIKENDVTVVA